MADSSAEIAERIRDAHAAKRALQIVGGGSKAFFGRDVGIGSEPARAEAGVEQTRADAPATEPRAGGVETLAVSEHRGIVAYEPKELVMTARAGTPLTEIEAALAEHGQMLSFQPPHFGANATLGGTLACNLSGPARPWSGSMRDMVLGVGLVNGRGEELSFGGRVMKNVAGFDVSRLQAGALGAFGVITRISLKVLPAPASTLTLVHELDDADTAIRRMNALAAQPKPLNAAAWCGGRLYLRLAGAESALAGTAKRWGGERLDASDAFWRDLAEQRLRFFEREAPLWRFSVKSTAAMLPLEGDWLIDWAGAQRFVHGAFDKPHLESLAEAAGGHVTLYRGGDRAAEVHHTLAEPLRALHLRLKSAFDPDRIVNPGRLYSWL